MNGFGMLAAAMVIIMAAGFTQSLTSFGFALIALPLLSLFLPLQQAVPIIVIFSLFICLTIVIPNRRDIGVQSQTSGRSDGDDRAGAGRSTGSCSAAERDALCPLRLIIQASAERKYLIYPLQRINVYCEFRVDLYA